MPKYLIERDAPGVGQLAERDVQAMSKKSSRVMRELGPDIQWQHSYVSGDKIYCVYIASGEEIIREHGNRAEIPITRISQVGRMIDPTTGENGSVEA